MPRFFIDLRNPSGLVRDEEGAIYTDIEDALEEAKASALDMIRQYMDEHLPPEASCVEVRDVQGRTMASLTVAELLENPTHPAFKNNCADLAKPGHR